MWAVEGREGRASERKGDAKERSLVRRYLVNRQVKLLLLVWKEESQISLSGVCA